MKAEEGGGGRRRARRGRGDEGSGVKRLFSIDVEVSSGVNTTHVGKGAVERNVIGNQGLFIVIGYRGYI